MTPRFPGGRTRAGTRRSTSARASDLTARRATGAVRPAGTLPRLVEGRNVGPRLPIWCFGGMCLFAGAAIVVAGHGTFLRGDDWDIIFARWGLSPDALLAPHNEHLIVTQVIFYEAARKLAGWHYGAYA